MLLVEIEGVDGSGKSSLSQAVTAELVRRGINATQVAFPCADTLGGRVARAWLNGEWKIEANAEQNAYAHQLMQVGSRLEWLAQVAYEPGDRVFVLDRWLLSATVYGTLDGLSRNVLWAITANLPQAELRIYLDCSYELSMQRRNAGCEYEQPEARKKVIGLYRNLAFQRDYRWLPAEEPLDALACAVCTQAERLRL